MTPASTATIGISSSSIDLEGVAETLLIPLAARMLAADLNPDLAFADPVALRIGEELDFDPRRFADDRASLRGSIVRAHWFDALSQRFLQNNPQGLCVSIGSGLDWRSLRLSLPAQAEWCDVELPQVAAIRERLVPSTRHTRTIAANGGDFLSWLPHVPWTDGRPLLVLAEGVLMYLEEAVVTDLLLRLVGTAEERGSVLEIAFDYASPFMVRHSRANHSVAKTEARFRWGLARPQALTDTVLGLRLVEEADLVSPVGGFAAFAGTMHHMLTGGRRIYGGVRYTRK